MNKQERFEHWSSLVIRHPKAKIFDAQQFRHDMLEKNFLTVLDGEQTRLMTMMETYIQDHLFSLTEQLKLNENQCKDLGHKAMTKFIQCHFANITRQDTILINNAYQSSDPIDYPVDDPYLRLIFDMVVVLDGVLQSVSKSFTYSLE